MDELKQILSQFNKARGKFPEGKANILHLKCPFLTELSYDEFDDLMGGFAGKLNQSSTISGVVLTWDHLNMEPDGSVDYGMVVGSLENFHSRCRDSGMVQSTGLANAGACLCP